MIGFAGSQRGTDYHVVTDLVDYAVNDSFGIIVFHASIAIAKEYPKYSLIHCVGSGISLTCLMRAATII